MQEASGNGRPARRGREALREQMRADLAEKRKELPYAEASDDACKVLNIWNSTRCGPQHKLDSAVAQRALYALDRSVLKKLPLNEVLYVLDKYADMRRTPRRHNLAERAVSIDEFFSGNRWRNGRLKAAGKKAPAPLFDRIRIGGDKSFGKADDATMEVADTIRSHYTKAVMGVDDMEYGEWQEMDFVRAAKRVCAFAKTGRVAKVYGQGHGTPHDVVRVLFTVLKEKYKGDISTWHLWNEVTWKDIVPRWLAAQERTGDDDCDY